MKKNNSTEFLVLVVAILLIMLSLKLGYVPCFEIANELKLCAYPPEESSQEIAEEAVIKYLDSANIIDFTIRQSYKEEEYWKIHVSARLEPCCEGSNKCISIYWVNQTKIEFKECGDGRIYPIL